MFKNCPSPLIFIGLVLLTLESWGSPRFINQDAAAPVPAPERPPRLILSGVVVAEEPRTSVAVLKQGTDGRAAILRVGDKIKGLELIQVSAEGAVLSDGRRSLRLSLAPGSSPPVPERPAEETAGPNFPESPPLLPPANQSLVEREFDRDELIKRIRAELPRIMKEIRWVPHFSSEGIDGLQIVELPSGSQLITETGIREGDIIRQINGIRLNHPSALGKLQESALTTNRFEVVVEREAKSAGSPMN